MNSWKVIYSKEAENHIKQAVEYYNNKSEGLGSRFYEKIKVADIKLKSNPYFQVRYNIIRCLPLEVFPYMIHFEIDETRKLIKVYAVISTYVNPTINWKH